MVFLIRGLLNFKLNSSVLRSRNELDIGVNILTRNGGYVILRVRKLKSGYIFVTLSSGLEFDLYPLVSDCSTQELTSSDILDVL